MRTHRIREITDNGNCIDKKAIHQFNKNKLDAVTIWDTELNFVILSHMKRDFGKEKEERKIIWLVIIVLIFFSSEKRWIFKWNLNSGIDPTKTSSLDFSLLFELNEMFSCKKERERKTHGLN